MSSRGLAQYVGINVRPDVCAPIQLIAPGNAPPSRAEKKLLEKLINSLTEIIYQGLDYLPVDLDTARTVLLTDTNFANARIVLT